VTDLRAAFLPFGPIHSIDLPTLPSILPASADPNRAPPPPRARGFAFIWFLVRKDAEKAMETVNGKVIKKVGAVKEKGEAAKDVKEGRPVAVDWALSKEKWQETQKVEKGDEASEEEEEDEDENEDEEEEEEQGGDEDVEMAEEEPVKPALPTVEAGSTLFIRNLPFETTEQELGTL
jgi:nucleolar protein 4